MFGFRVTCPSIDLVPPRLLLQHAKPVYSILYNRVSSLVCHSESCFMCVLHVVNAASETDLAEVALNILCLLMREQWSWLCTENIQRTIRLLFGTLINR